MLNRIVSSPTISNDIIFLFTFALFWLPIRKTLTKNVQFIVNMFFAYIFFLYVLVNNYRIGAQFSYKFSFFLGIFSGVNIKFCCLRCVSERVGPTLRTLHDLLATQSWCRACRSEFPSWCLPQPSAPHQSNIRVHALSCNVYVSIDKSNF